VVTAGAVPEVFPPVELLPPESPLSFASLSALVQASSPVNSVPTTAKQPELALSFALSFST